MTTTIKANTEITVRFIGDAELRPKIKVVARTKSIASIILDGTIQRRKINTDSNGNEFIKPYGNYSMAPVAY